MHFWLTFLLMLNLSLQDEWITFTDPANHFSVLAPKEMSQAEELFLTDLGPIAFNTYSCQGGKDDQNALYIIHHYKYPEAAMEEGLLSPDSLFAATIDESLNKLGGSLDYQRPLNGDKYPGVLFRIKYNKGNAVLKCKSYLVEQHFYSIQVFTTIDKSLNFEMDRFLDSFRLLEDD